jgi:L-lactate dehydrogenase
MYREATKKRKCKGGVSLKQRKVVVVGCGLVGMSFAYSMVCTGGCDKLALIDINREKLMGEVADLCHGIAFAERNMDVYAGSYSDCRDADIVMVSAGVAQVAGEGRISLLRRNKAVFDRIIPQIVGSGFNGILIIATNPVDIMTGYARSVSGLPHSRVMGSGTMLDTGRLKFMLGSYFSVDPKNVHAYVMGEHGDSEFVAWSQASIATKSIESVCIDNPRRFDFDEVRTMENDVRNMAYKIIEQKGATCYGIATALCRLTSVILSNERSILTPSCMLMGEYGRSGVYIGVPAVVGRDGICEILELELSYDETEKFNKSCDFLMNSAKAAAVDGN